MSSFLDLGFFFVHNNPETEDQRSSAQAALNYKTERERMQHAIYTYLKYIFFFRNLKHWVKEIHFGHR